MNSRQIEMIVRRLRKQYMEVAEKKDNAIKKVYYKKKLEALKAFLTSKKITGNSREAIVGACQREEFHNFVVTAKGITRPEKGDPNDPDNYRFRKNHNKNQHEVDAALQDMEFELVMANAEGWREVVKNFEKKFEALLK